jgi:hypothetical protein
VRIDLVKIPLRISIAAEIPADVRVLLVHGYFATTLRQPQGRRQTSDASPDDGDFDPGRRCRPMLSLIAVLNRSYDRNGLAANVSPALARSAWVSGDHTVSDRILLPEHICTS